VTHDQDEAAVVADRIGVMRGGRILAEGDPQTVLTLPADAWVASFLGVELPLECKVEARSGSVATLRCGDTMVLAETNIPLGTRVIAGIRPEDVMIFGPGTDVPASAGRNRIDAEVIEVTVTGITSRVVARSGSSRFAATVSQAAASTTGVAAGSRVTLIFDASAVIVAPVTQ